MKENQNIEWKASWRNEYIKWICGFANAQGGQLPENWTVGRLFEKHASVPYNPLIANAFFRAGLIEAWGRGIYKIISECETFGVAPPKFNSDFSGLMVEFKARIEKTLGKTLDAILLLLDENPSLSIPEIAEKINKSESAVERAIRKLREEGRLKRIGPAKGGHWEIIKDVLPV